MEAKERKKLEKDLAALLAKRERAHSAQMERYRSGSATRARTTTHNATVANMNERIVWLRAELATAGAA